MEGNTIWSQLVLGIVDDEHVPLLVDRLVAFQWPDGGWNCGKQPGAHTSSVQETLLPHRGLAHWYRLFFCAVGWGVWAFRGPRRVGINSWWSLLLLMPLMMPLWMGGNRRWQDNDAQPPQCSGRR